LPSCASTFYSPPPPLFQTIKPAVANAKSVYEFSVFDIHQKPRCLDCYKGRPILIINVASSDPQAALNYTQLQSLFNKHNRKGKGLAIVAFPCNQFNQEPGSTNEILAYAREFGVTFDLMDKVGVEEKSKFRRAA
jgi:glutathione peroxidase-family protein